MFYKSQKGLSNLIAFTMFLVLTFSLSKELFNNDKESSFSLFLQIKVSEILRVNKF